MRKSMPYIAAVVLVAFLMFSIEADAYKATEWKDKSDGFKVIYLGGMFAGWFQHYRLYLFLQRSTDYEPSLTDLAFIRIVKCLGSMTDNRARDIVGNFIDQHPNRNDEVPELAFDALWEACPRN
jgi:hypothetical protein